MGKFLAQEKIHQTAFKIASPSISESARLDGLYKTKTRPYCLPRELSAENLFPGIRASILAYFDHHEIKWHDAIDRKPSNHMCDSQVCCANFLFPFADKPVALAVLLRPIFPTLEKMLPIEDSLYVAFEWIGQKNYLSEKISRNRKRTRGANFTSPDAAVMFQHVDGRKQIVLIEWKYTETYFSTPLIFAKSGTDRRRIYAHLFDADDCPLDKTALQNFDALFFEPFYQFMRQQFLANEMEKAHELGADVVSLLHISPACNIEFKRITSRVLENLGNSATDVWMKLVKPSYRFLAIHTEDLFGLFDVKDFPELLYWKNYMLARYPWISLTHQFTDYEYLSP